MSTLGPSLYHPFLPPNGWASGEGYRESNPGPNLVFAFYHPSPSQRPPTCSGSGSASTTCSFPGLQARFEGNSEQTELQRTLTPQVGGETNLASALPSRKNHVTVSSDPELQIIPAVRQEVGGAGEWRGFLLIFTIPSLPQVTAHALLYFPLFSNLWDQVGHNIL